MSLRRIKMAPEKVDPHVTIEDFHLPADNILRIVLQYVHRSIVFRDSWISTFIL